MFRRKSIVKRSEDEWLREVQWILRERLSQKSVQTKVYGLDSQRRHLLDLMRRCVSMGESNSALVIGPRGSGKTMLLQSVLDEVKSDNIAKDNSLQVNLNGLLQTDDRIALKEITRQLQLENTLGDKVFGSFAETLAFLL
ncbi:origin recognition complex subunit 4-like [Ptychodera flava]|uniref:origin recognition complex subunit 4-like n=1 Tax=Ptychodera flava TaxID=63121 RepID=UPI00396A3F29